MYGEKCVSPLLAMVYFTAMLMLGIAWAVVSQPGNKPWPSTVNRVSLRILKRTQFDQISRKQIEGFETSDRFHRLTRNNELFFGRLNRINKRNKTAIPRLMDDQLQSLEEKPLARVRPSGHQNLDKHGLLGFLLV